MAYTRTYVPINWQNYPNTTTPLNATNLLKIDAAIDADEDELVLLDTTKADQEDLLGCVNSVTYNSQTGVFTFGFVDGTSLTADLNIEKIPVSFSMDENGIITMTTSDGSTYTADVGALIKTYTFSDSSTIDFSVTTDSSGNKTVTADIIDGSITGSKLQPNYLADCQTAKQGAESAETSAQTYAGASMTSSYDSEAYAVGTREGVPVGPTDPAYENNAKYYAEHTGVSTLDSLSNVDITNPQDGEALKYNSTTGKWENGQVSGEINTYDVETTDWVSNTDTTTSTDYPYIAVISSSVYTNDSRPIWQMNGVGTLPTGDERASINLVMEAIFDASGVTLYATDLPEVALVLEVKGV